MMLQCSAKCFQGTGSWLVINGDQNKPLSEVYGNEWYAETSNPCYAAAHSGTTIPSSLLLLLIIIT